MSFLKYWWIAVIAFFFLMYALSTIADIIVCIREHKEPENSTVVFVAITIFASVLASFIYWAVTI